MSKKYRSGTHRSCSPADTLLRIRPYLSQMGITRIANITGLDHIGIPVFTACRPNARALSVAQGKGLDDDSAKVSAIMEAMESCLAEFIDLPLKHASYNELILKYQVINVTRLAHLSISHFHFDLALLWVEGRKLAIKTCTKNQNNNTSIQYEIDLEYSSWVPFDIVHSNYTLPLPTGSGSFLMSTNGLASGNCIEEAICHAVYELLERDSTSLWQLQGGVEASNNGRLDLSSVTDENCITILQQYQQANITVAVWDTTSDLGICAFYCTIIDKYDNPVRQLFPASGAGCHVCREVALLRALTEAAQTRLTLMSGARDDTGLDDYVAAQDVTFQKTIRHWLQQNRDLIKFKNITTFNSQCFAEDLNWVSTQLANNGIHDIVVVDLSKPEFDISVVRVIIPGLEGISDIPGYLPGERATKLLRSKMIPKNVFPLIEQANRFGNSIEIEQDLQ